MESTYLVAKALHIIFVVTWFAGLFYIFRLFVYHAEALQLQEPDKGILSRQYGKMESLLWRVITAPSAVLTVVFGSWMLFLQPDLLYQPFMQIKLVFVCGLLIYHFYASKTVKTFASNSNTTSSTRFRYLNEVSTVILIAVVFLIVLRDSISWIYGVVGILGVAVALMIAIRWYRRIRESKKA